MGNRPKVSADTDPAGAGTAGRAEMARVMESILDVLERTGPQDMDSLTKLLPDWRESEVQAAVWQLVNQGRLRLNWNSQFELSPMVPEAVGQ